MIEKNSSVCFFIFFVLFKQQIISNRLPWQPEFSRHFNSFNFFLESTNLGILLLIYNEIQAVRLDKKIIKDFTIDINGKRATPFGGHVFDKSGQKNQIYRRVTQQLFL